MNDLKSYRLSDELVGLLEAEFQIQPLVEDYRKNARGADPERRGEIDKDLFGAFGRRLADRICALESRYRDAGAEVIYRIAEQTGHRFPSIQQRLIEVSLLAVMNANRTRFHEISYKRLSYEVSKCVVHEALQQAIGQEAAAQVPCRHLCLNLIGGVMENTGVAGLVTVDMPTKITDANECCIFAAQLKLEEQLRLTGGLT